MKTSVIFFVLGAGFFAGSSGTIIPTLAGNLEYSEQWGYANVRPKAYMFWWLYYAQPATQYTDRPLVMWLQGGPGSSGCGYGNFQEIGPLDVNLKPRNFTWLQKADLLFVDNPVGTGFSYVTDNASYTVNVEEIAQDMLTLLKQWFTTHPQYKLRPFYIISESYGGKMTAAIANVLYPAVMSGAVKCNFKGIGLGDSWISPMDFVNAWGPYLYHFSYLSDTDLKTYAIQAQKCQNDVNAGRWWNATDCWNSAEELVGQLTDDVSWYNVLKRSDTDSWSTMLQFSPEATAIERLFHRHVRPFYEYSAANFTTVNSLGDLMNGPIKKKLGIIPAGVSWGGQAGNTFERQGGDFMTPVISTVDNLIANTSLKVVVYEGQLDLICCTVGTEMWMKHLTWQGLSTYRKQEKIPFHAGPPAKFSQTAGFYKKYKNFYFFWIMRAGHMVPADAPYATLKMLDMIFAG